MKNTKYYNSLNLIRIIATVEIAFFFHYCTIYNVNPFGGFESYNLMSLGSYIAVENFFQISGFTMYQNCADKIRNGDIGCRQYIIKRIKRIYPMMIASTVIMAIIQWSSKWFYGEYAILKEQTTQNSVKAFIMSLFGVNSGWICDHDKYSFNGVTWFISIIMICYVLFFFVIKLSRKSKLWEMLLTIIIVIMGIMLVIKPLNIPLAFGSNGRGYLDFFLGVFLAQIHNWLSERKRDRQLFLVGCINIIIYIYISLIGIDINKCCAISLLLNTGIMLICIESSWLQKITSNKIVTYFGNISFDIYLWNLPSFAMVAFIGEIFNYCFNYNEIYCWGGIILFNFMVACITNYISKIRKQGTQNEK